MRRRTKSCTLKALQNLRLTGDRALVHVETHQKKLDARLRPGQLGVWRLPCGRTNRTRKPQPYIDRDPFCRACTGLREGLCRRKGTFAYDEPDDLVRGVCVTSRRARTCTRSSSGAWSVVLWIFLGWSCVSGSTPPVTRPAAVSASDQASGPSTRPSSRSVPPAHSRCPAALCPQVALLFAN